MENETLKNRIAEVLQISPSDAELAYKLCIDKVSENLNFDEALKIPELGIFTLKKEPLTREERLKAGTEEQAVRKTLIFSPSSENREADSNAMFLTIDLDKTSSDEFDFDENVFSLGVDKPLVPAVTKLEIDDEELATEQKIHEKVSMLVTNSEKIQNFDLWDDYVPESKPEKEEESPIFDIAEDEELKELISKSEIGEETKEPEQPAEIPDETIKESDEDVSFDILQEEIDKIELNEIPKESSPKEDEELDIDALINEFQNSGADEEKSLESEQEMVTDIPELEESTETEEEISDISGEKPETKEESSGTEEEIKSDEEEINWDWGDELKEELEEPDVPDDSKSEEAGSDPIEKIAEEAEESDNKDEVTSDLDDLFDQLSDSITEEIEQKPGEENADEKEIAADDSHEDEDEGLDLDFDIDSEPESKEQNGESEPEKDKTKTIEYSPGEEPEKEEEKKAKAKINFFNPLYLSIAAFVVIGVLGSYYIFFSGDEPITADDQKDVDTFAVQLQTKLEPHDDPIVKTDSEKESVPPDIEDENVNRPAPAEDLGDQTPNQRKVYKTNTDDASGTDAIGNPKAEVKTAKNMDDLYREIPNEKQISNLVFFDGKKYNVQVSSWKTAAQAEAHATRIRNRGIDAFIVKAYLSKLGGTWYRVRVGSFNSAEEANKFRRDNKF